MMFLLICTIKTLIMLFLVQTATGYIRLALLYKTANLFLVFFFFFTFDLSVTYLFELKPWTIDKVY